jgi:hypothetical protein
VFTEFWYENLREIDHLEDLKKGGRIILIGSSINGMGRHRWTDQAKGRDKW